LLAGEREQLAESGRTDGLVKEPAMARALIQDVMTDGAEQSEERSWQVR